MFTVVGEALVDLVGERGGAAFVAHPGGSPANVAIGLTRLGSSVRLVTRLGEDPFGELVRGHLEDNDVQVDAGPVDGTQTSLAIASLAGGAATYDFRILWDVEHLTDLAPGTVALHTGSLATALEPGAAEVLDHLRREDERGKVTISYDPNVRSSLMGSPQDARAGVEEIVALADVVKVSDEDLEWLYEDETDVDVARRWLASGPALVVVTRGGDGVVALTAEEEVERPSRVIDLADTVGAGDSFTAGLLDGLRLSGLLGGENREALAVVDEETLAGVIDRAATAAGITCSRAGANPPTARELDEALDEQ